MRYEDEVKGHLRSVFTRWGSKPTKAGVNFEAMWVKCRGENKLSLYRTYCNRVVLKVRSTEMRYEDEVRSHPRSVFTYR